MNIWYSIGAKLGHGIGYTAKKAIEQLRKKQILQQKITLDDIPLDLQDSITKDNVFDVFASMRITKPITIGHFWGHMCYSQILKSHNLGAKTVVERASSHINTQNRLLKEECKRLGYNLQPIPSWVLKKQLKELQETDFVTVPSEFSYNSFLKEKYPENKLLLNPYGVDVDKFKPINIEKDDTFKALFLGENWIRKGAFYVEKAWESLHLKNAKLYLKCPMSFPSIPHCNSIEKISWVDDIVKLYNEIDVFILPSIEEGNALVIGEAASCATPSITTFNSGTWLEDDKSCMMVPIRDVSALKEKIQYSYDNPSVIKQMGKEARKQALKYTWEKYGERLVEHYEKIESLDK